MDDARQSSVTSQGRHRASVAEAPVTSLMAPNETFYDPDKQELSYDEEVLAALGYKSEFRREFSLFTTFSVSFAVLGLLPSFASTLYYGMGYAGTAGMTWGWIIASSGIMCVALGMAEICSAMPTSGGLYYAAAVLAPKPWGPITSWFTGWSSWLGQVTAAPSVDYGIASMILAAASIANPDYKPQQYQVFLLCTLLMIFQTVLSSFPTKWVAQVNSVGSTFNMIALVVVIILIPAGTNRTDRGLGLSRFNPNSEVWGDIYHGTEWPAGISVLMSFLSIIWTLSGYDSPFHIAEECSNANIASPRAIVMTAGIGSIMGWFLQLVVAYTVVDIGAALASDLEQPFAAYLIDCMPQSFALGILALTVIAGVSMGQGCMVAASRVTFAYARDGCFPLSRYWRTVNKTTRTPVNAVIVNCIIGVLLTLLIFGGTVTISSIFNIGAIAQFVAFTIPIFLRVFFHGNKFKRGPWHLGRFSLPIGGFACAFVIMMVPIMCFPAYRVGSTDPDLGPLSPDLMNWTCLVYGAPMLFAMFWWFIDARKWFKGPKLNVEHMINYDKTEDIEAIHGHEKNGAVNDINANSSGSDIDEKKSAAGKTA